MPFLGATTLADLSSSSERWSSLDGKAEELVSTIMRRHTTTIRNSVARGGMQGDQDEKPEDSKNDDDHNSKFAPRLAE